MVSLGDAGEPRKSVADIDQATRLSVDSIRGASGPIFTPPSALRATRTSSWSSTLGAHPDGQGAKGTEDIHQSDRW
jgi:hypothetical protein